MGSENWSTTSNYANTEVGIIPEEWAIKEFQEVCQINMGQSPKSVTYNDIGEGLPFYQGRKDFGRKYPTVGTYCTDPKKIAQKGDVLLTIRAPVGDVNVATEECCIGRGVAALRLNNGNNDFLYYLMRYYESKWRNLETGTTFGAIKKDDLRFLKVPFPPDEEQRRIASILSTFDDKIELNHQMNRTLEEMASAIFKLRFVDFEPFRDGEFEYSEELEREILKGWEVKSVYSLADYINGMAFKMSDFAEKGLPIIKIAELNNGITDNTKLYNGEYKEKYFLRNGDVLFSWSASLGVYLWDGGDAILNQHIFNVKPKGTMKKPILYFLLKEIVNEFIQIAAFRATTMGHIKKTHLQEKKIAIPDDGTMKTINDLLEPVFEQIIANKLENHSLAQIRDSLLPKLLSGEIRVNLSENNNMFKAAEDINRR